MICYRGEFGMIKLVLSACLLVVFLCGAPRLSYSDEEHYNNLIIGDRATGMAGAYTAISDDPSGLFYNPAGIVYSPAPNFTASANAFNQTYKTYKNVLAGGGDWKRESSTLLPNFLGVVQPLGKGMLGFSIAVPDSLQEDQDQVFSNLPADDPSNTISSFSFTYNMNQSDKTNKIGPSYAVEINNSLAVGMSLFWHYREKELIQNQFVRYSNNDYTWINSYYQSSEKGVQPLLGVMWNPVEKLALGLKISKTFIYDSETRSQSTQRTEISWDTSLTNDDFIGYPAPITSTSKREHPANIRLGAAWFASDTLLFSGDFSYFTSVTDAVFGDREATWNVALGMEKFISPRIALRGGVFSNNANTKDVVTGGTNQQEHIDFWGLSASLSKYTRSSSITLGANYAQGSGEAQLFSNSTSIQDVDSNSYTLYLSTAYSF